MRATVAAFRKYDVWDKPKGALSIPKPSLFEMRIPTDPETPTHRISSYLQSVPKVDFIYKEIELMDGHIIEQYGNKRPHAENEPVH